MFRRIKAWALALMAATTLVACGGGGGDSGDCVLCGGGGTDGVLVLSLTLSTQTVTSATPATVTAHLQTESGDAVPGVVVSFSVANGLGALSANTALTDADGNAIVTLTPADSVLSGADTVTATANANGATYEASRGFALNSTTATFTTFTTAVGATAGTALSAYGQSVLTVAMDGVSEASPATVTLGSSCVTAGKAEISPATVTTTTGNFTVSYVDDGCGAVLSKDTVTASLSGSSTAKQVDVFLTTPTANSITFVSASPEDIYLKGTGLAEASTVTFLVEDTSGNPLSNQAVTMNLTTFSGGLTIDGGSVAVTKTTVANGTVSVTVNSGTVPTPVRVSASLASGASTVSNSLAVGVGLPSQLNFSMSQTALNIEGFNIDGTTNAYTLFAADRSGNPVPTGTAITYWAEGGQVASGVQTTISNGISSATAQYVSQDPKPADGRVTIVAYAIGEESFVDLNGNNVFDSAEPFQDLGNVVKDVLHDNSYDDENDEFVSSQDGTGTSACVSFAGSYPKLALSASIPSRPGTCDGEWSNRTYVRRAVETVLSTSSAGLIWATTSNLDASSCHPITLQSGSAASSATTYYQMGSGDTWYGGSSKGSLPFYVSDSNSVRFNPMAAGTTLSASNATEDLTVSVAGTPIASTTSAPLAAVSYELKNGKTSGQFTLRATSPSGLSTSYVIGIESASRPTTCP